MVPLGAAGVKQFGSQDSSRADARFNQSASFTEQAVGLDEPLHEPKGQGLLGGYWLSR